MNESRVCVLLVDDDEDDYVMTRDVLSEIEGQRYDLEWVATYEAALEAIETHRPDVCLVDYHLGAHNGLDLMREVLAGGSTTPIILLTGQGGHEVDVEAMKAGAADYLIKGQIEAPLLGRSIRYALKRAQDLEALQESKRFLQSTLDALSAYIAILDDS
ncbi:MAG: response regulator, partial [Candidatus Latescibacteria bacterium]|nr:response regulator [Candidatus Latescibacterota bacterium]